MIFVKLIARLPFRIIYVLSYILFLIVFYVLRYRRNVVYENIQQAFPKLSKQEVYVVARNFYRHLCNLMMEVIKSHRMNEKDFKQRCSVTGAKKLMEARNKHKTVIVLTIHQGNWEWILHSASLHLNIPIDPIYKPLHHKGWDDFMQSVRGRFNSHPIPMQLAGREMLKARNHFRLFVMLADQAPNARERSHWVSYLNKEAPFYIGTEKLAHRLQCPVFFAQCRRTKRGYYEVELTELDAPPYKENSHENRYPIIDAYVKSAENAIYEQPETFLWSHRRWKRSRQTVCPNSADKATPATCGQIRG